MVVEAVVAAEGVAAVKEAAVLSALFLYRIVLPFIKSTISDRISYFRKREVGGHHSREGKVYLLQSGFDTNGPTEVKGGHAELICNDFMLLCILNTIRHNTKLRST
jgi:hypothetical protein